MQSTLRAFLNMFPEKLKKRTFWYLFDRYLGHFLREKLSLDQLSVDIIDGKGCINQIGLDVGSLNEELSFLPFQFIDGCFIDEISLYVPWSTLLTESCGLQIKGSTFICQLKDADEGRNMGESDYLSRSFMSSSMQLAEEIVHEVEEEKFEGLEIFAQLIDSVLRRVELVATNTTFILRKRVSSPPSFSRQEYGHQDESESHFPDSQNECYDGDIMIKVRHLKCEENAPVENETSTKSDDVNLAPKMISKRLTVKHVELFIGDSCISVLEDKHVLEIKVKDNKCDIQVYLSSILVAAMQSKFLTMFMDIFAPAKDEQSMTKKPKGEKTMSLSDYARIEQQLQTDFANLGQPNQLPKPKLTNNVHGSNPYSYEAKFLSLNEGYIPDLMYPSDGKDVKSFHCTIKFPGVAICLFDSSYSNDYSSVKLDPKSATIDLINAQLDESLEDPHIRLIVMPLQLDISSESVKIVSGDYMIGEQHERGFTRLAWTDMQELKQKKSVNLQCDIDNQRMKIVSRSATHLTLDSTFLERFRKYYSLSDSKTSEYSITFECDSVQGDLLFPVADLRKEYPFYLQPSEIRPEILQFQADSVVFKTNLLTYEISMDRFIASLVDQEGISHEIGTILSSGSENIKVSIKTGPSASIVLDCDDVPNNPLLGAGMEESIYISSSDQPETISPFQTKRKVIKSTKDDDEQVISPKDLHSSLKYFESCQSLTQLQIEVIAPLIKVVIANKSHLDLLYNRFGNDLALWYPSQKSKFSSTTMLPTTSSILNPISNKPQAYFTCKSGLAESLDSDTSFHSADGGISHRMQNYCTCIMHAERLRMQLGPESCHHLIESRDLFMGVVVGLEEDTSNVVSLHGTHVAWDYEESPMIGNNSYIESISALSLTFEVSKKEGESKKIKFALQLADALLYNTQFDIFTDLWNYINVTNEEVLGYVPLKTLTELHFNLINGAIIHDKSLNVRPALVTLDGAYITAMMVEDTCETLFRLIVEESALYFKKNNLSSENIKNFVCVVDSGLIDLYLKFNENGSINFRASNNIINVRACSDSLNAISSLILSMVSSSSNNSNHMDDDLPPYSPPFDQGSRVNRVEEENLLQEEIDKEVDEALRHEPTSRSRTDTNSLSPMDESDFWILGDDDVGAGIKATTEPTIRVLIEEPIQVIENYFGVTKSRPLPELMESILQRYLLEEMTLLINFYGGKDFEDGPKEEGTEKEKAKASSEMYRRGDEPKVRFVDNSIHLWESLDLKSEPSFFNNDSHGSNLSSNFKLMGGRFRQNDVCVQLYLSKIKSVFDRFNEDCSSSWRFIFMVNEIEIRDRVSKSNINKMLYEYSSENMPRRNSANMIYVRANTFKNSIDNHEECDLKVSIKPLRINIDQDTIMFLVEYFNQMRCLNHTNDGTGDLPPSISEINDHPVASASNFEPGVSSESDSASVSDSPPSSGFDEASNLAIHSSSKPSSLFVKSFLFAPDVPIRLDYHGKRVDFEQGALPGLLMGLAHLNQSELKLKKLHQKHGILGIDRVLLYALTEWFEDIKRHQLPSILGSIGPMNSVRQLIQGLIDLVWIPVDQYRRDRRLVRGLQRGASSFSSSTAMAVIDLANRLVQVIQGTAQFAHDVVSSSRSPQPPNNRGSVPTSQPRDLREGVATAYTVMREGLNQTYRNVATAGMQAEGYGEAVGGLIRQIPSHIFQPIIKVSEATSNVLVGMRNQLTPEARKEDQDKWKS